jgi:hypothetical protein
MNIKRKYLLLLILISCKLTVGQVAFLPSVCYQVGIAPRCLVSADFNNDGKLDIATSDWGGASASVILGNGDGTFNAPTTYSVGATPQRICTADFNSDGILDLVTANFSSNNLSILFGMGNGSFNQANSIAVGDQPWAIESNDFNMDGKADLAVTLYAEHKVAILLGDGIGGFALPVKFATGGTGPNRMVCADYNNDSKMDLVIFNWISEQLAVLVGDGTGGFSILNLYVLSNILEIVPADFDSDGNIDLALSNMFYGRFIKGDGAGNLLPGNNYAYLGGGITTSVCVSDLNEDGKLDIIGTSQPHDSIYVVEGIPGLDSFSSSHSSFFPFCASMPYFVMSADFNGDSHADLATANDGGTDVTIYLNALPPFPNNLVETESMENIVIAYPNPAYNEIKLKCKAPQKEITVSLFDYTGCCLKTVKFKSSPKEMQIDLDGLTSGFYIFKVISEGKLLHVGKLNIIR